jgi:hypothetical protein
MWKFDSIKLVATLLLALFNMVVTYNAGSNFQTTKLIASISKQDGTITIWGDSARGGVGVTDVGDIKSVASNNDAFAAIKTDGRYVLVTSFTRLLVERHAHRPPPPPPPHHLSLPVLTRSVVAWGDISTGGVIYPALVDSLVDVTQIVATFSAFCAIKHDKTIITWGTCVCVCVCACSSCSSSRSLCLLWLAGKFIII